MFDDARRHRQSRGRRLDIADREGHRRRRRVFRSSTDSRRREIVGTSLTAVTVTVELSVAVAVPSVTVSVIVAVPA